jgi:hypothetical protein
MVAFFNPLAANLNFWMVIPAGYTKLLPLKEATLRKPDRPEHEQIHKKRPL